MGVTCAELALRDGRRWCLEADDNPAARLVTCLAEVMQLPACTGEGRRLRVRTGEHHRSARRPGHPPPGRRVPQVLWRPDEESPVECVVHPDWEHDALVHLVQLALVISQDAHTRRGVLLHAGLVERNGRGVLLAGPSGVGKTTLSERLPSDWHSRCDDTTLVVRDGQGDYWAHPWPTWSRFVPGGPGGSWNVPRAVQLQAIFCLNQAHLDQAELIGAGQAVCLIQNPDEPAWQVVTADKSSAERRALHLQRFANLCDLARAMPVYRLHVSLNGPYWREIERVLGGGAGW